MRPGGLLILTTPNPSTVMAAVRTLRGSSPLWGTREFIDDPKIDRDGAIISHSDIHYREYTQTEITEMLTRAGLVVERSQYLGLGPAARDSPTERWLKRGRLTQVLMSSRLFGSNHYFVARKT